MTSWARWGIPTETALASGTSAPGTLTLTVLTVRVGGRAYDVGRSARDGRGPRGDWHAHGDDDSAVENPGERRDDNA